MTTVYDGRTISQRDYTAKKKQSALLLQIAYKGINIKFFLIEFIYGYISKRF